MRQSRLHSRVNYVPTRFSLVDILVLDGTTGARGMPPPASTGISARLKRVQGHGSRVNMYLHPMQSYAAPYILHRRVRRDSIQWMKTGATASTPLPGRAVGTPPFLLYTPVVVGGPMSCVPG